MENHDFKSFESSLKKYATKSNKMAKDIKGTLKKYFFVHTFSNYGRS